MHLHRHRKFGSNMGDGPHGQTIDGREKICSAMLSEYTFGMQPAINTP